MNKIISQHSKEFDFDAVVNLMDDDIRKEIHYGLVADITDQEFYNLYCKAHKLKFEEEFEFNVRNPQV